MQILSSRLTSSKIRFITCLPQVCDDDDHRGDGAVTHRSDVIRDKFMNVTGAMMPCSCRQTPKGIAPGAHLGDGNADLIMVRGTSRLNYLRYLVRVAFQRDSPFELPFVEVKRVREFRYPYVQLDLYRPYLRHLGPYQILINMCMWFCNLSDFVTIWSWYIGSYKIK